MACYKFRTCLTYLGTRWFIDRRQKGIGRAMEIQMTTFEPLSWPRGTIAMLLTNETLSKKNSPLPKESNQTQVNLATSSGIRPDITVI